MFPLFTTRCLHVRHDVRDAQRRKWELWARMLSGNFAEMTTSTQDEFHPAPGSKLSLNLHEMYQCRCTAKNAWWWAERLPETCRVVIPIKLEFSASVGFIHKECVTLHGHTIFKKKEFSVTSQRKFAEQILLPSTRLPAYSNSRTTESFSMKFDVEFYLCLSTCSKLKTGKNSTFYI